jgi:hypothetical protein
MNPRVAASLLFVSLGIIAGAEPLNFACVTDNSTSCPGSPAGFSAVVNTGANTVEFVIFNNSPLGVITSVFFDEGRSAALFSSFSIVNGSGVNYQLSASGNFGAGIEFSHEFSFKPKSSGPTNGINFGETLTLIGALRENVVFTSANFSTTIQDTEHLRIGIHVQELGNGASDKMTSVSGLAQSPAVPEPSTYVLIGSSLVALGLYRLRSNQK